jgi:hypothetical protein
MMVVTAVHLLPSTRNSDALTFSLIASPSQAILSTMSMLYIII